MAKISGEQVCSQCGFVFLWDYQIPNRLSDGRYDVEPINKNVVHCKRENAIHDDFFSFSVYCPHCNRYEVFEYTPGK